ncbi:MAG: enolase C-terminal domain-like protein, partial [Candidatus Zixiibacteriota bacterium]
MKIDAVKIYRYSLKLKNPLTLKDIVIAFREGLVIKLQSGDYTAWGEIAPLPGFSHEDLQKAIKDSLLLQSSLTGSEIPTNILPLDKAFEKWLDKYNLSKSVRFGFETAILHLIAQSKKTDFISLLNNKFIPLVKINGLLIGDRTAVLQKAQSLCEIEYTAFKLKVGRESIKTEIETIRKVREIIGDNSVLRLDANRSFNLN